MYRPELSHAWLNLWDKHMTTGRINQVTYGTCCRGRGRCGCSIPGIVHPNPAPTKQQFKECISKLALRVARPCRPLSLPSANHHQSRRVDALGLLREPCTDPFSGAEPNADASGHRHCRLLDEIHDTARPGPMRYLSVQTEALTEVGAAAFQPIYIAHQRH